MSGIGRIGFLQGFNEVRSSLLSSQSSYIRSSLQLNSGEKILELGDEARVNNK